MLELGKNPNELIKYRHIDAKALLDYREMDGTSIRDIINSPYIRPSWVNTDAIRKKC
ncbi:MAG: hypothetical protein ACOYN2_05945 [Patescibacteria group bacterium]